MFTPEQLAQANRLCDNTLASQLGMRFVPSPEGTIAATMPVDERTRQPMGLLHGGATAALAETVGSVGSAMLIDPEKQAVVGIEVSANHLRGVRSGFVTCTATLLHRGSTLHLWDMQVTDDNGKRVAACRLSTMVIAKR